MNLQSLRRLCAFDTESMTVHLGVHCLRWRMTAPCRFVAAGRGLCVNLLMGLAGTIGAPAIEHGLALVSVPILALRCGVAHCLKLIAGLRIARVGRLHLAVEDGLALVLVPFLALRRGLARLPRELRAELGRRGAAVCSCGAAEFPHQRDAAPPRQRCTSSEAQRCAEHPQCSIGFRV